MSGRRSISALLSESAARHPGTEALIDGDVRLTYADMDALVDRLAHGLQSQLGLQPGEHAGMLSRNRVELALFWLAVNRCGAVAVALNTRSSLDELAALLEFTDVTVCFFDDRFTDVAAALRQRCGDVRRWVTTATGGEDVSGFESLYGPEGAKPVDPAVAADAPATIMFTSGTTGMPKAVVTDNEAEWLNAALAACEQRFGHGDRTLQTAPLFHGAAWGCSFLPHLAVGGTSVMVRDFDPALFLQLAEAEKASTLLVVPTHLELLRQSGHSADGEDWRSRRIIVTAAPVRLDTVLWAQDHLTPNVANMYGLTETGTLISICPPSQMHRFSRDPCIGLPMVGTEWRIVRPDLDMPDPSEVVEDGASGQLVVRCEKQMRGYYRNADATASRLRDGWVYTGDLCYADVDGFVYHVGRVDDVINTGGEKVYPTEIELVINQHPGVRDSYVAGAPDDVWGQRVVAFVVRSDLSLEAEDLREWLKHGGHLAGWKRPREVRFVDDIPRNASGKVDVRALRRT